MRVLLCLLLIASSLTLSACVPDHLAFWHKDELAKKQYIITGIDNDTALHDYISSVINNQSVQDDEFLRKNILNSLRSKGFYNANVTYNDGEKGEYNLDTGMQTLINAINIEPLSYSKYLDGLNISVNDPLDASEVLDAQKDLYKVLQKENCAFALEVGHRVVLNPITKQADLYFDIEKGKEAVFGATTFIGNADVKDSYLTKLVTWKEGECFDHEKIEEFRRKVLQTNLFNHVSINLPEDVSKKGSVPIEVALDKKPRRSISAGLSYYSDDGIGLIFGWEHRNLLKGAEKFNADLSLSLIEQSLNLSLKTPHFLRKDQSLSINSNIKREDSDAYDELSFGAGFVVKRSLNRYLIARAGADFEVTRIDNNVNQADTFGLVSPHMSLLYDNRDDKLDPHKGWLLSGEIKPVVDVLGTSSPFVKSEAAAQNYYEANDKLVLAARAKIGTITGANTIDIPATYRFYSGGGGSVRGFGYQEIGEFKNGRPLGGRSLFETSLEARFKVKDKMGVVAFIDAGQVDDQISPSFSDMSVGAGLGFRYYTDFGPVRFDVATPLTNKENTDNNYQIYISIGQAF